MLKKENFYYFFTFIPFIVSHSFSPKLVIKGFFCKKSIKLGHTDITILEKMCDQYKKRKMMLFISGNR
ncbi:hypothetical protein COE30_17795 [Bacillus cereus]|nr:hypothetical protein COE30_17795 [Bacillus cereus]